jgi:LacI family transcriptional regulator
MSKKQSIHTIAKEVGLSATTVSLIINGVGKENRISDAAIKRVEDYLEKIDYSPNVLAKALRTGKTNVIGMLVEDISDPFFSSIARGVEVGLEQAGYRIFFMSTKNKLENAKFRLDVLKSYNVDGFIMAPTPGLEKEIQKIDQSW